MSIKNFFARNDDAGPVRTAHRAMTELEIKGIIKQVKLNPLAGRGFIALDDLIADALLAHWNLCVRAEAEAAQKKQEIEAPLVLKTVA